MIEQILTLQDEIESIKNEESSLVDALGVHMALPGLRGFWPMTTVNSSGDLIDESGNGLDLTLTGNPDIGLLNNIVPYIVSDGVGDYYERADEALLDITGADTGINSAIQGLTMGCWFLFDDPTANRFEGLMCKMTNALGNLSYYMYRQNNAGSNALTGRVSSDGTAFTTVTDTTTLSANTWYHLVFRFTPSTELALFLSNQNRTPNTTSIPATIYNGAEAFAIGAFGGSSPAASLFGKVSLAFLCAAALPDATIGSIYQTTRGLFGV